MTIPTLTTERLTLQPFKPSDAPVMHRILNGKDVLKYFPGNQSLSLEQVQNMIDRILRHWDEHHYGLWAVKLPEHPEIVGRCGLQYLAEADGVEVEVDFILDRPFWGQGIATEAGKASLNFGFDMLGLNEITGLVHPENVASQRVLEKIGMTFDKEAEYFGMVVRRYVLAKPTVHSDSA